MGKMKTKMNMEKTKKKQRTHKKVVLKKTEKRK